MTRNIVVDKLEISRIFIFQHLYVAQLISWTHLQMTFVILVIQFNVLLLAGSLNDGCPSQQEISQYVKFKNLVQILNRHIGKLGAYSQASSGALS